MNKIKPKMQTGTFKLTTKTNIAPRVWEFTFKADQVLDFKPGQFFMLEFPNKDKESEVVKRAYSAASLSGRDEIKFLIKLMPKGVSSEYFETMKMGDELSFSGPYGALTLADDNTDPLIFIVTGTGLAPVWSILNNLKKQGRKNPVHLLMGVTSEEDAFYLEEFKKLSKKYPFTYSVCIEKPREGYSGVCGFVTQHISTPPIPFKPESAHVYIVGNPIMVKAAHELLKKRGWPKEKIHIEKFS